MYATTVHHNMKKEESVIGNGSICCDQEHDRELAVFSVLTGQLLMSVFSGAMT